jgi:hypothetical protein
MDNERRCWQNRSLSWPRSLALLILLAVLPNPGNAGDGQWICIADAATGFRFENGKWTDVSFDIEKDRYVISKSAATKKYKITKIGESFGDDCEEGELDDFGWLHCGKLVTQWRINLKSLRYILTYPFGYAEGFDNNADTPLIEIGKCSPL